MYAWLVRHADEDQRKHIDALVWPEETPGVPDRDSWGMGPEAEAEQRAMMAL